MPKGNDKLMEVYELFKKLNSNLLKAKPIVRHVDNLVIVSPTDPLERL